MGAGQGAYPQCGATKCALPANLRQGRKGLAHAKTRLFVMSQRKRKKGFNFDCKDQSYETFYGSI